MISEEQKQKISKSLKEAYASGERKRPNLFGVNNPMYGRKQSEVTKEKIRQKAIGRKGLCGEDNPATRDDVRLKISKSAKGRIPWNKGLKGWVTEEHKNKIREGNIDRSINYKNEYVGNKCFISPLLIGKNIKCEICDRLNIQESFCLEIHHKDRNKKNNKNENIKILCRKHHLCVHMIFRKIYNRRKTTLNEISQQELDYISEHINEFITK